MIEKNLRYELQIRRNRVLDSNHSTYISELKLFFDFLRNQHYLLSIVEELKINPPNTKKWMDEGVDRATGVKLPETEFERVKLCLALLEEIRDNGDTIIFVLGEATGCYSGNLTDLVQHTVSYFIKPLYDYLDSRVEENNSILYVLKRFKHKVEWFKREELFNLYEKGGEKELDAYLREFLFDQGIEYPFSNPESPSGKADIVADVESYEALILEVKIFNPDKSYEKGYIKKGFLQAHRYTNDYSIPVGFLFIFNAGEKILKINTKESTDGFMKIQFGDKTIYIVIVEINPNFPSASRTPQPEVYEINEEYLRSSES